jgi:hypothetical protein
MSDTRTVDERNIDDLADDREQPRAAIAGNVHAPAAATAAVITKAAAGAGIHHVISGIAFSYSAAPTGGNLTITDGGVTVFNIDITAAGWGQINFDEPIMGDANAAMVVTLASGAGAVVGKVNLTGYWTKDDAAD